MESDMLKRRNAGVLLAAAASALLCGGTAYANPTPTPIAVEILTPRAAFTDEVSLQTSLKLDGHGTDVIKSSNASNVLTQKVTVEPGAQIPWHTHHGPVFVTIAEGEMTYISSEDCTGRHYPTGTAFVDPGHGHVHTAYNSGKGRAVFVATFFEVPKGDAPITIPADAPADCKIPTN
jgi:quercetin dioxygenase-like cupin family protein